MKQASTGTPQIKENRCLGGILSYHPNITVSYFARDLSNMTVVKSAGLALTKVAKRR